MPDVLGWCAIAEIPPAPLWHALRADGINDRMEGFGRLKVEF